MKKVLVVDDDAQFVEVVRTLLEAKGYDVLFAYQPQEGYELATQEKPDIMILDVMFAAGGDKFDGFDMARKLRQDPSTRDIRVIMVSGVRKVLNLPFKYEPDDTWLPVLTFLEKPVKPEALLGEVEKAFEAIAEPLKNND